MGRAVKRKHPSILEKILRFLDPVFSISMHTEPLEKMGEGGLESGV